MTDVYNKNGTINFNSAQTFNNNVTVNGYNITTYDYFAPSSGNTVTIAHSSTFIHATGTLAALTIALPASPLPGQEIEINSDQIVTTLTITGGTLLTSVTALAVDTPIRLMYESNTTKWVKR
jgi:hypothetical protein